MIKNKIMAIVLVLLGVATGLVDGDCTVLIFMLMVAIPTFFAKESWFYED